MKKLLVVGLVLVSSSAFAAKHGYGEAGCGLGTQVMGPDGNQVLAATTNGTSYNQTFAISSGTSECVDHGAVKSARQVPMFIEVNKLALAKEAARGQGETLAGLAQLMGCQSDKFGQAVKANYNQIFVDSNMQPTGIESGINAVISTNKAQACGA